MKIFIYKVLIAAFVFILVFEITIGSKIKQINKKINSYTSSEGILKFKEKLKLEIEKANNKESILKQEEKILLQKFIDKVMKEISNPIN